VQPIWPDGSFLSIISLHLCEHARVTHTQAFVISLDVCTREGHLEPTNFLGHFLTGSVTITVDFSFHLNNNTHILIVLILTNLLSLQWIRDSMYQITWH
jgi:hypothetical protein